MMFMPSFMVFFILYIMSFYLIMMNSDWFMIWVGLELNMLSFIMLIYDRKGLEYIESCLSYFFIQSLGSALLMSMIYFSEYNVLYFGSLILSYKMGVGPFYFWFPSVCSSLNWISCFFLMSVQSLVPLILMMFFISWLIWYLIILSLILGALGSFNEIYVKRLMAFSSIHHSGWIMMCMYLGGSVWLFYLIMYMWVIFPIIFMLNYYSIVNMLMLDKWKMKWWFIFSMFSMAGMPPFLGFFLKWISFYFIMEMDYSLIFFMLIISVVMFYVYIRIIYDLLMGMGIEMGWNLIGMKLNYFYSMDFFMLLGLLLGFFIMFSVVLYMY